MCVEYFLLEFVGSTDDSSIGSRRLLTYRRLPDSEIREDFNTRRRETAKGNNANDLNSFRKRVSVLPSHTMVRTC